MDYFVTVTFTYPFVQQQWNWYEPPSPGLSMACTRRT